MSEKEATARIKINKLLEAAGWRFFRDGSGPANIRLEPTGRGTSGVSGTSGVTCRQAGSDLVLCVSMS